MPRGEADICDRRLGLPIWFPYALRVSKPCIFCERIDVDGLDSPSALAVSFLDRYPVSPGHTLIVPKRHVASLLELESAEIADVWRLIREARTRLDAERKVDGWNIGTNVGEAGGQTVGHAHVHLIPRYRGDVPDPRGGVRGVIPAHKLYPSDGSAT